MTIELSRKLETMLIGAERYACGRRTYIVSETVEYLSCLLPKLSDWCLGVLRQDMADEFGLVERSGDKSYLGDECDYADWVRFRCAVEEEATRRGLGLAQNPIAEIYKAKAEGNVPY